MISFYAEILRWIFYPKKKKYLEEGLKYCEDYKINFSVILNSKLDQRIVGG